MESAGRQIVMELLLPRTDAGAIGQAVVAAVVFALLWWAVRRDRDVRLLVGGMALFTFAMFGLRAAH